MSLRSKQWVPLVVLVLKLGTITKSLCRNYAFKFCVYCDLQPELGNGEVVWQSELPEGNVKESNFDVETWKRLKPVCVMC